VSPATTADASTAEREHEQQTITMRRPRAIAETLAGTERIASNLEMDCTGGLG
jgi:hypothetical protein